MTPSTVAALLVGVLLIAALGGPALVRRAAPAIAATPRLAIGALTLAALVWIAGLVAVGPIVAWMSSGPAWLPARAAEVCERCLAAATPFGESGFSLAIPAVVPLALPILGIAAVIAGLIRERVVLLRSRADVSTRLKDGSATATVLGRRVRVSPELAPFAFSLPTSRDGVVVSQGALNALASDELAAVLEHEYAHQAQHHHALLAALRGATHFFRWIPLIAAVRNAVPHYLEIAADRAAQQRVGTSSLASALLKLGEHHSASATPYPREAGVLHAAGSERVKLLIGHPMPPLSRALAAAAGAYAIMLTGVIAAVHAPYAMALVTGC